MLRWGQGNQQRRSGKGAESKTSTRSYQGAVLVLVLGALAPLPVAGQSGPTMLYILEPVVVGLPTSIASTLTSTAAQAAAEEGLNVMTRDQAVALMKNLAELQGVGADSPDIALSELGRAIGAKHLLAFTVSADGSETIVHATLVDSELSKTLARRSGKVSAYDGLVSATQAITRLVLAPVFAHLKGNIEVSVSETEANIHWDGSLLGTSPMGSFTSPGGSHLLEVNKTGFIAHREQLRVMGGADVITRMIVLRPSPDYLRDYRAQQGLLRNFAWGTSIAAVPLGAAWVTFARLKGKQDDNTADLSAEYENTLSPAEQEAQRDAFNQRISRSRNDAQAMGNLAVTFAVTAGIAAAASIILWAVGEDPDRYQGFEGAPPTPAAR